MRIGFGDGNSAQWFLGAKELVYIKSRRVEARGANLMSIVRKLGASQRWFGRSTSVNEDLFDV